MIEFDRSYVVYDGSPYRLPQALVNELKAAMELWTKLSVLVGCTSPDGSAELGQVQMYMEMSDTQEITLKPITVVTSDEPPPSPVAPRAEAVRGAYSIDRRTHTYHDSGEGWCLICGEPDHGDH